MEGSDVLSTLAVMDGYRRNDNHCDYGHRGGGKAATAIGLAAGLGGGALLLGIAGLWGINQASKARFSGNQNAINALTNLAIAERGSREAWQNNHAPTITQYVDNQNRLGALSGAFSSSNAFAQAEANLVSGALTGQLARCPQEVTLVSKQNCGCPATNHCGCGVN